MSGPHVVLVDRSRERVSEVGLTRCIAALQTQVDRDFGLVWGARADVGIGTGRIPSAAWSVSIVDNPGANLGITRDGEGNPHALVRAGDDWTLAVSHALLEMLANPDGGRLMEGLDVTSRPPERRVQYLVEVCDPCQVFHYEINGVRVSDFVTPDYYRTDAAPGEAYDFMRRLRRPLQVPRGCSLTWRDAEDGRWHQRRPDLTFVISRRPADMTRDPRADRDDAFPADQDRHDIATLRRRFASSVRRGGRRRERQQMAGEEGTL
jgi:hypothetical protein